jgi:cytoskeletal protein RodZ
MCVSAVGASALKSDASASRRCIQQGGVLMPSWVWVVIALAAVVVLAIVVWQALARRRTGQLQEQFGPEYDRTVGTAESKREAEAELQAREERRRELEIRPLPSAARYRYLEAWQGVQSQFVDDPSAAVARADELIQSVMSERGYPVEDFEQRAADVSVDHPQVVENYREGHRLAQSSANGSGSTEDLRQAMRRYRALFDELVEPAADDPTARERQSDQPIEEVDSQPSEKRVER